MVAPVRRSFYFVGLIFSCVLAGMIVYVSLITLQDTLPLRNTFYLAISMEAVAALVLLPDLLIDDLVHIGKLSLSKLVKRRFSQSSFLLSFALMLIATAIAYEQIGQFIATMVFAIYPAALLALVCVYTLITSLVCRPTGEPHY